MQPPWGTTVMSTENEMKEDHSSIGELLETAKKCRRSIVQMVHRANAGHPGGSLSAIDMLVALYKTRLNVD